MIQNVFNANLHFMDFLDNLFVAALLIILYGKQEARVFFGFCLFVVMPQFQPYRELWNNISLLIL